MARKVQVEISGNARNLEKAFDRAIRKAEDFNRELEQGKYSTSNAERLTVAAAKLGAGLFAAGRAFQSAGAALEAFQGQASDLSVGLENMGSTMSSLVTLQFDEIIKRAKSGGNDFAKYATTITSTSQATEALGVAQKAAALGFNEEALAIRTVVTALQAAEDAQRGFNRTLIDGTAYAVAFKGAVDDLGRGPRIGGLGELPQLPATPFAGLSPEQRTDVSLIGVEGTKRIPLLLQDIADEQRKLNNLRAAGVLTSEKHAEILTYIATIEDEIKGINEAAAAARKAAAEAAAAEAARLAREAAERARRAREAARAAEQARQLAVLQRPIPTPANLGRQLEQLQGRIRGGETVPKWMRDILARIPDELKKNITPQTREAIRDFFQMVRGEFDKGDELLRRFPNAAINTNRLTAGLGLDPEQLRRLRMRLAGVTGAGQMGRGAGAFGIPLAGNRAIQTTVVLDGQVVGRSVKRFTSNDRIHSPSQKRGPHAGR